MAAIWWIRRDLRLSDNPALHAALAHEGPVVPVFILDPHLLKRTPARRQEFLFDGLRALDADLRRRGSSLLIRFGEPLAVLQELSVSTSVYPFQKSAPVSVPIFAEEDFTPYACARDARIASVLPLHLIHGQTVHHPLLVHKQDGASYTVFTPFSKAWKALLPPDLSPLPAPDFLPPHPFSVDPSLLPSEFFIRFSASKSAPVSVFPVGEAEAQRRLDSFIASKIRAYDETRNRLDLDGTSSLSPYIRFGMLSLRQAAAAALNVQHSTFNTKGAETWLNELIWREFYISILYHFQHVAKRAFNPALQNIRWRDDETDFNAWKAGRTGMPVVDAAMRQLLETGWMHNRARMIVASFLVKDLLINWQWGERWFMDNLLDGDPAANNGGWQWTAGTGTDAAPYFRIFNPVLQGRKFDPNGDYIRKWLPELAHLPIDVIHAPWEKNVKVLDYPSQPIVDRAVARERTLKAYNLSKSTLERLS